MSWRRLATFALGGALGALSVLVPPTAAVAGPAGALLIGWATRWPEDEKKPPKKKEPTP